MVFCYLRSGVSIFPEIRAIVFNNNQTWSNPVLVKSGVNFVDAFFIDNTVRWGDYTGIAFKYNPISPEVWVSGCYGSSQNLFNTNYNCFNNWIAQITDVSQNITENDISSKTDLHLFPNPVIDLFNLEFDVTTNGSVKIDVSDMTGKLVTTLFNGHLKLGRNSLTFNKSALQSGTYILSVKTDSNTLLAQKIIVKQ